MKHFMFVISAMLFAVPAWAQEFSPAALEKASQTIAWGLGLAAPAGAGQTVSETVGAAKRLGLKRIEVDYRDLVGAATGRESYDPTGSQVVDLLRRLNAAGVSPAGVRMAVYRVERLPASESELRGLFGLMRRNQTVVVAGEPDPAALPLIERLCDLWPVYLAITGWEPKKVLALCEGRSKRIGAAGDLGAWMRAGIRPVDALHMLKNRLITIRLDDCDTLGPQARPVAWGTGVADLPNFIKEAYRMGISPMLWTVPGNDIAPVHGFYGAIAPLAQHHQEFPGALRWWDRLPLVSEEETRRIEQAIPALAPAKPKKSRKLLVIDQKAEQEKAGHPANAYANLAVDLMGKRTGAYAATITSDPDVLKPERLRQFDAVYLNNNAQPDLFDTPEARDSFAAFIRGGGGLVANHAATVISTGWKEFGAILGARGASHRLVADERVTLKLDDPGNPLNAAFNGKSLQVADEFFRFTPPYSRARVRVLQSFDVSKTDMDQGFCFGNCIRQDNDYAVTWVHTYGSGRVFYTVRGHGPAAFWDPRMLQLFLAGIQFAMGDLPADSSPDLDAAATVFAGLLAQIEKCEHGQQSAAQIEAARVVTDSLTMPAWRARVERSLLAMLERPGVTLAAKDFVCRQLGSVGSAESVPVLARMLKARETVEMARHALERIPGPVAERALRDVLDSGAK